MTKEKFLTHALAVSNPFNSLFSYSPLFNSYAETDCPFLPDMISCLTGSACRTTKPLVVNTKINAKAIKLINDRYNNWSLVFQTHIRDFYQANEVQSADILQLHLLQDHFNARLSPLETMGVSGKIKSGLLVYLWKCKLVGRKI